MVKLLDNVLVGRTSAHMRVYVTVELSYHAGESFTVDHTPVIDWTRVSFTALGYYGTKLLSQDCDAAGQLREDVRDVATVGKVARGVAAGDVAALADLWERWHLNDMKAGCVHQPEGEFGTVPDCPETGYRHGHAWLVKPLDADGDREIRELCEKLARTN